MLYISSSAISGYTEQERNKSAKVKVTRKVLMDFLKAGLTKKLTRFSKFPNMPMKQIASSTKPKLNIMDKVFLNRFYILLWVIFLVLKIRK